LYLGKKIGRNENEKNKSARKENIRKENDFLTEFGRGKFGRKENGGVL